MNYGTYQDQRDEGDYLDWMLACATEVRRTMAPDASFFLNITGSSSRPWLPFELMVRLRGLFQLQNHITWVKSISVGEDSLGHFKPIRSDRFLHRNHEHIFHLTQTGNVAIKRLAGWRAVQGQEQHRAPQPPAGPALPWRHLVHSLLDGAGAGAEVQTIRLPSR